MAANAFSILDDINIVLHDTTKPWNILFTYAERRTGINRLKLFFGVVCVTCMLLIPGSIFAMLLSDLLGFAFPAYATIVLMMESVRQLPSRAANDRTSVSPANRLFTYWLMFAATLTVQQMCAGLLRFVPFYCLIKTAFFVWCAAPIKANGSAYVYALVVRRYFSNGR
ncbi:PREDICTED: receptor expression-enhancing protein 5-like [Diuraphis noxia]|uniref:receptor expression-enhancing protein 5-like n=1 Tax=Diuraphis noxia TaxID=143948 RepID=UPI0007639AC2|nr:PREDICTED: receptor expression-enhancing protein 5-like [Diuraphis noxia]